MPVYENSAEDLQPYASTNYQYEQPLPETTIEEPKSEGLYFEPEQQCSPCQTVSDVTSRSNSDETGFKRIQRTTSDTKLTLWLGFITVLLIFCIGGVVAMLVLYVQANKVTKDRDDIKLLKESFADFREEFNKDKENRNLDFKKQLQLYWWYRAGNGHWYRAFKSRVKYGEARENCEALGTRLAGTGIRNRTIKDELVGKFFQSGISHTWIGLDDLQERFKWVWSDGVLSAANSTQWKRGKPSANGNQRCGYILEEEYWPIGNKECNKYYSYLCETKESI